MKKILLFFVLHFIGLTLVNAQDTIVFNVSNLPESEEFCVGKVIVIYAEDNCDQWSWEIDNVPQSMDNPLVIQSQVEQSFRIEYYGCNVNVYWFHINYYEPWSAPSFTETIWKHFGETITINPALFGVYGDDFLWSTGETNPVIGITEPGVYTLERTYLCGTDLYTFIIQDNVELYRATVDLATNLNKVTWQVTDEQAEYISEVKIYRDGLFVGTAPYAQGYFLDAIGSDNAARNYRIAGVSIEGEDCPIESYEKGTIHTTYYQDVNGNLNMTWNIPYVEEGAQGTLTYFQICKYDPITGEITVVDQVNSGITDYTCGANQFDGGQAVIAAVFNDGKGMEELSFSNLTADVLAVGEDAESQFRVYPNPTNGAFTVECCGHLSVMNLLGQEVLTQEVEGKTTLELPKGIYFVRLGSITQKFVVE